MFFDNYIAIMIAKMYNSQPYNNPSTWCNIHMQYWAKHDSCIDVIQLPCPLVVLNRIVVLPSKNVST